MMDGNYSCSQKENSKEEEETLPPLLPFWGNFLLLKNSYVECLVVKTIIDALLLAM